MESVQLQKLRLTCPEVLGRVTEESPGVKLTLLLGFALGVTSSTAQGNHIHLVLVTDGKDALRYEFH